MTFLLTLIIIAFLLRVVAKHIIPWALKWYMHRQVRRVFGDQAAQQAQSRSQRHQRAQTRAQREQAPRQRRATSRKKIIDKDVGEYVDFEDIPTYSDPHQPASPPADTHKYKDEPQISDADWEDIK